LFHRIPFFIIIFILFNTCTLISSSSFLMIPISHVLRFNSCRTAAGTLQCAQQYQHLSKVIFGSTGTADQAQQQLQYHDSDPYTAAEHFAERLQALSVDLKLPQRLRDVHIGVEDLPIIAAESMKQVRLLPNNPREVTYSDALKLYEQAH
jgi:alcohol dehydrogenase class IV